MAEFIYRDHVCKLKFGEHVFELPLNETTADNIEKRFYNKINPPTSGGIEEVDAFYDSIADEVDGFFGEGAADAIMEGFKHPGIMELLSVVDYIVTEFNTQYKQVVDNMKNTAHLPNRETRRARARR